MRTAIPAGTIEATAMALPDVFLLRFRRFPDERGEFFESFREDALEQVVGHPVRLRQTNYSVSHRGVVRGIHGAVVPPGQAKIISCVRGAMLDIAVDLRVGSPTFGRYTMVPLDEHAAAAVYLGEGIGHAFVAMADDTCVHYQCSTTYVPGDVITVNIWDEQIGLPLAFANDPVLSPTDVAAPTLEQLRSLGVLPFYQDCLDYHDALRSMDVRD